MWESCYHQVALCSGYLLLFSPVRLFVTPWTAALQASLSFTTSWSLLKLMSSESVMPSNHLILCCPFSLLPQDTPQTWSFLPEGQDPAPPSSRQALAPPARKPAQTLDQPHPPEEKDCAPTVCRTNLANTGQTLLSRQASGTFKIPRIPLCQE